GIDIEAAMRDYRQSEENVGNMEDDLEDAIDDLEDAEDEYDKAKKKYRDSTSENEAELESARDSAKKAVESAEKSVESARRSLVSAKYSLADQIDSYTKAVRSAEKTGIEDNRTISENMVSVLETELSNLTTNDDLEEQISDYEIELNDCKVTAPISGIVTSVSVVEGDEYDEKSTICEIQDDTSYRVKATVDQYDIASVKEGMSCVVKTEATEDEEMTGTLTFVSPVPEGSSSTGSTGSSGSSGSGSSSTDYPIEISIDERDERIRIGMTAESSVLTDSRKGVLVVPYEAIQEDMDGSMYLNVANRNGGRDSGMPGKGRQGNGSNGSHGKHGEGDGIDTEASLVTMTAGAGREMAIEAQSSGSGEGGLSEDDAVGSGLSKDEDVGNGRNMSEDGLNSNGDGLDMQMASFGGGVENKKNADASFGGGGGENEESADASFGEGGSENEENDDFSFDGNEPAVQTYSDDPVVNLIATIVLGKSAEQTYAEIPEIVPTRRVDITTGLETDYYTEILSGDISEGDEVLTSDEVSVSFDTESFSGGGFSLFGGGGRRPGSGGGGRRR
ncbi:MAG: HlyD family efflux transporter periplasmic adaptor subunit, partial [Lachnospiraceae bacterium]|nr:HlyD family efflux transporter periplasmic adaptor subunit [Lachnospiraceae bacterium]